MQNRVWMVLPIDTGKPVHTGQRLWLVCSFLLAAIASLLPTEASSATGTWNIIGKVVSSETGEPLAYANVALWRFASPVDTVGTPAGGAIAKADGTYRLPAAPGLYRLKVTYTAYRMKKSARIEVREGAAPITMDFALVPEAVKLETIQVTASVLKDSEAAILAKQKNAAAVSDGISSQQIAKTTDNNAAEVLQRVTGLSVVSGRYIYVRGMGERYSQTEINGATIGTPEPNKRVVPLDLFAAGLLDNVVVQKTYTPDQPGDFGGGVVNVSTRDFPGKRISGFSISTGYNGSTTGNTFYNYKGGKWDFLGLDDGTRAFPDAVERIAGTKKVFARSRLRPRLGGFSADTLALLGRSFTKTWNRRSGRALPATGLTGTYGNELSVFDRPLGLLGSFSYSNGRRTSRGEDNFYKSDEGVLKAETAYQTVSSTSSVLWGALTNGSYRLNDFNTIAVRAMYNRSADDETRFYEGDNQNTTHYYQNTRFDYVERGLFAGSISTSSFLAPLGGATLDLRLNYSRANRNEPDRREYTYMQDRVNSQNVWLLAPVADHDLARLFGKSREEERGPEINFSYPFRQWAGLDSKLKAGYSYKNKYRYSEWRRFHYKLPTGFSNAQLDSILSGSVESYMTNAMIAGTQNNGFVIEEQTQPVDNFWAHQTVGAEYLMIDVPLSQRLRVVAGARVEHATEKVNSWDIFGTTPDSLLSHSRLNNTDILPSVNLAYSVARDANLRFAYSATVSRPDFRELSLLNMYDFVDGYPEIGNPRLKRTRVHNWDLRFETYPGPSELGAFSLFYKKLTDPIEKSLQGGSVVTYMPINARSGYLGGGGGGVAIGTRPVESLPELTGDLDKLHAGEVQYGCLGGRRCGDDPQASS